MLFHGLEGALRIYGVGVLINGNDTLIRTTIIPGRARTAEYKIHEAHRDESFNRMIPHQLQKVAGIYRPSPEVFWIATFLPHMNGP